MFKEKPRCSLDSLRGLRKKRQPNSGSPPAERSAALRERYPCKLHSVWRSLKKIIIRIEIGPTRGRVTFTQNRWSLEDAVSRSPSKLEQRSRPLDPYNFPFGHQGNQGSVDFPFWRFQKGTGHSRRASKAKHGH